MSSSSPADLSVTFRSVPRRLHEAQVDGPAPADLLAALDGELAAAAELVRSATTPEGIAAAIDEIPSDHWAIEDLDGLRAAALEIGDLLRRITAATGS